MKQFIPALALAASLVAGVAHAQAPADPAKGNAPLKPAHTVNDGGPRRGASSFTEGQARQHIEKSGFTNVSGLAKGQDGVWRGKAMRNGQSMDVAMDFKGNVTTPLTAASSGPPTVPMAHTMTTTSTATSAAAPRAMPATATTATTGMAMHHRGGHPGRHRHHRGHHRHHHAMGAARVGDCANPGVNGAACSGVDRNHNGISDKEDRAIKAGAKP